MATDDIKRLIELGVNADPALRELQKLGRETEKQTSQLDQMQKQLTGFANGIKGTFVGLGISEAVQQVVGGIKSMIDEFDHLGEASQAVGLSVTRLQELRYALQLGGNLEAGETNQVLTRLSDKLAELNDASSNTARIFKELGITTSDTVDTALLKLADAFQNAPDGIDKTALAVELFGRNLGQKMVPALNQGSEGVAELTKELHALGGVIDDETAQQAADFNDNLDKLAIAAKSLGIAITASLLPDLVAFTNQLVEAIKQGNVWEALMNRMAQNNADMRLRMKRWFGFGEGEKLSSELAEEKAAWDKLTESMRKNSEQELRSAEARALPKVSTTTGKKTGGKTKTVKEEASELETWWKNLQKAQEAIDNTPEKIAKLNEELAKLDAQGKGAGAFATKLREELQKLQPDPVVAALKKINDEAQKLAEAPKVIEGLAAAMDRMQAAGPPAGEAVRLTYEQLLKLKAAGNDAEAATAGVTLELINLRKEAAKNQAMQEEWWAQLGSGAVTGAEFAKGVSKYYDDVGAAVDRNKEKVKDYGDILEEWSGKFTTDFIDEMIDGMGEADRSFGDMVESMIKQLAKLILQMQVAQAFKAMGGGWGGLFTSAQGHAWAGPGLEYMAQGGILGSPTFFRSGSRLAVAGEAGPEAVVPLQRSATGDLGVGASPVNITINNTVPDAQVSATTRDNDDGQRTVEIWVERKVRSMMTDGSMDRTMRASYGLSRQPSIG